MWKFVFISGFVCCEQDWLQLVLSLNLGPGTIKNIEGDSCFALFVDGLLWSCDDTITLRVRIDYDHDSRSCGEIRASQKSYSRFLPSRA